MMSARVIRSVRIAAAMAVLLTSHATISASAQSTAPEFQTDRPDFTEGALIVRRFQIESGYTFTRADGTDTHSIGEMLLRIGLAARAELRITANYVMESDRFTRAVGFEDPSLGVKLRLYDAVPVSVIMATTIPTGPGAGSGRGVTPEIVFVLEPPIGSERMGLGINAGIASEPGIDGRRLLTLASAVLGLDLTNRTGLYIEAFGHVRSGDEHAYVDGGVTHMLTPDLQIDFRVGTSIVSERENFIGVGLSRRFR